MLTRQGIRPNDGGFASEILWGVGEKAYLESGLLPRAGSCRPFVARPSSNGTSIDGAKSKLGLGLLKFYFNLLVVHPDFNILAE